MYIPCNLCTFIFTDSRTFDLFPMEAKQDAAFAKLQAKRDRALKKEANKDKPPARKGRPPKKPAENGNAPMDNATKVSNIGGESKQPKEPVIPVDDEDAKIPPTQATPPVKQPVKRRRLRAMVMTPQGMVLKNNLKPCAPHLKPSKAASGSAESVSDAHLGVPPSEEKIDPETAGQKPARKKSKEKKLEKDLKPNANQAPEADDAEQRAIGKKSAASEKRAQKARLALKKMSENLTSSEISECGMPGPGFEKMSYTALPVKPLSSCKIGVILYTETFYVYQNAIVPEWLSDYVQALRTDSVSCVHKM